MTWLYQGKEFTSKQIGICIGFVYEITNLTNGKKYIGKKGFSSTRKAYKKKTEKRAKRVTKESDWQAYYGSNDVLQAEVVALGAENFKREIVRLCISKGEMSYYELKAQLESDCLLKPDLYYNSFVGGKIHRKHLVKK